MKEKWMFKIKQSVMEILLFSFIVYAAHLILYYPLVWIGIFAVFSVLIRSGVWAYMEDVVEDLKDRM